MPSPPDGGRWVLAGFFSLAMGLFFYFAVTPIGLVLRLLGKDLLRLSRTEAETYWIERALPGPVKDSMGQQF